MKRTSMSFVAAAIAWLLTSGVAGAQWPNDSDANLLIADRPSEQVTPKIVSTSDGGSYVAWFDLASGNYDVYLQRLDRDGYEMWPHNGNLISSHSQNSWLVDWDLIADSQDNAVVVFGDARSGSDLDIYAYRISPGGDFLWGPDGVTLSNNSDFEPAPRAVETTDGQFVFVWSRLPDASDGKIMMQRLTAEGVPLFVAGGIPIAGEPGEGPGNPDIVASVDGSVIVSWVRDVSTLYSSPRHLRAERFSAVGATLWGAPVDVFNAGNLPIAYAPTLQADGVGGALFVWHYSPATLFDSYVQRLDVAGVERFAHNGVRVTTTTGRNHLDPTLSWRSQVEEMFVFWRELNSSQSQWGIYGQRVSESGSRLWGDGGHQFMPIDGTFDFALRSAPTLDGAMFFWITEPTQTYDENQILGVRVDQAGDPVWSPDPILVSSYLSGKSRLPITLDFSGTVKLVWEDDRNGSPDIYGQSVNPDGSLGIPIDGVTDDAAPTAHRMLSTIPNPFTRSTSIHVSRDANARDARIEIFDATGRLIRALDAGSGGSDVTVIWDGLDSSGHPLPEGVYVYRVARSAGAMGKAVLLR